MIHCVPRDNVVAPPFLPGTSICANPAVRATVGPVRLCERA